VRWAPDGSGLYFNVENQGSRNLYYASLKGDVRPVTRGAQVLTVTDVARGLAVGTVSTPQRPNDVVLLTLKDARLRPLTAVNDDVLAGKQLATVEELWVPSVDGMRGGS
jgi:dipeptidyl aminopeptidase/acylaminoacyl peptidase